jgi:hypothetical protein
MGRSRGGVKPSHARPARWLKPPADMASALETRSSRGVATRFQRVSGISRVFQHAAAGWPTPTEGEFAQNRDRSILTTQQTRSFARA